MNPQFGYGQVLFISQFNSTNHLIWSTRIEGRELDPYARVCADKVGNIYIGGQVRSNNYPLVDAGGYLNTLHHNSVITRFNPARQMTWSTYIQASFALKDLTTDDSCNLYVVADRRIWKFDSSTNLIFINNINTTRQYFWHKINYDPHNDQIHLLGGMNDQEYDFPTLNTACNGSFFNNGSSPNVFFTGTSPIFAMINHDGEFTYRSLADWPYEYYWENEMAIDNNGDLVYLFGHQQNGYSVPNPQLTNPGNGAYYDASCCYNSNGNKSALLLKLNASTLSVTTQLTPPTGCACNGSATAVAQCGTAPFNFLWSNGVTTSTNNSLCPGNHWVTVTDATGLSKTVYISIPDPPGSITSITDQVIAENCNKSNGVIKVNTVVGGSSPYTYSINGTNYNTSSQFTGLTSGNYNISVKDANGCVFYKTINVGRISGPADIILSITKSSCISDNGQIQINSVQGGIGPYTYSLNGSAINTTGLFSGLAPASYQLSVSDTAGCTMTRTILVERSIAPSDVVFSTGPDHCDQQSGFLQVTNVIGGTAPYSYSVDSIVFVNGTISNLPAGNYPLYIKDNNGCILKKDPVVIGNADGPSGVNININQAYCGKLTGELQISAVIGGIPPYTYAIDGNLFVANNSCNGIQPGMHSLQVKDAFNCTFSKNFEIDYRSTPVINLTPIDTTVCYDEMVVMQITGNNNQIQNVNWNIPGHGNTALLKATIEQRVYITMTDQNGCIIKDSSIIKVKPCNTPDKCLEIPNAFTPNNDGTNEILKPITNGCRIESINFRIYNRWSELIFETSHYATGWDGKFKNIPEPAGVYVYHCEYVTDDGIKRVKKGTIMLIR